MKTRSAAVVVVGDLARSPRMVNHARELARCGFRVWLVGYRDREFAVPEGVLVRALHWPRNRNGPAGWSLPRAGLRMGWALFDLLAVVLRLRPDTILVQNPPAFPTLLAAWIGSRMVRARFVLDWHNYGYSMLALRLGRDHWITRIAARYEAFGARRASHHFCVSEAMRQDIERAFGLNARVLYDLPMQWAAGSLADGEAGIVVCPSGWTADEDMDLLLDALRMLGPGRFEFHLTGDGPTRRGLEPRIQELRNAGTAIHLGFLEERDYRALLNRALIGLSLHCSSSCLDLPMKIVDLLGAGVPVCALDYGPVLREQVREGETGLFFRTAAELAELLCRLQAQPALALHMRDCVRKQRNTTWPVEWRRVAGPVIGVSDAA